MMVSFDDVFVLTLEALGRNQVVPYHQPHSLPHLPGSSAVQRGGRGPVPWSIKWLLLLALKTFRGLDETHIISVT